MTQRSVGNLIHVTMNLTEKDILNAEKIVKLLNEGTKAQAVSIALSLTAFVLEIMSKDKSTEVIIEGKNGRERLEMEELNFLKCGRPLH